MGIFLIGFFFSLEFVIWNLVEVEMVFGIVDVLVVVFVFCVFFLCCEFFLSCVFFFFCSYLRRFFFIVLIFFLSCKFLFLSSLSFFLVRELFEVYLNFFFFIFFCSFFN